MSRCQLTATSYHLLVTNCQLQTTQIATTNSRVMCHVCGNRHSCVCTGTYSAAFLWWITNKNDL